MDVLFHVIPLNLSGIYSDIQKGVQNGALFVNWWKQTIETRSCNDNPRRSTRLGGGDKRPDRNSVKSERSASSYWKQQRTRGHTPQRDRITRCPFRRPKKAAQTGGDVSSRSNGNKLRRWLTHERLNPR